MKQTKNLGLNLFEGHDKLSMRALNENAERVEEKTFGVHNKPSDSYRGNGGTEKRTISTGVSSDVNHTVLIRQSDGTDFAIVTPAGYIGKLDSTVVCGDDAYFAAYEGTIVLTTGSKLFNENGKTYRWYVL